MSTATSRIIAPDGAGLQFGDHTVKVKQKQTLERDGVVYNVKTHDSVTKLEIDGQLALETVPGATIGAFIANNTKVAFTAEGFENTQITLGLKPKATYELIIDGDSVGVIQTNMAGKVSFSVDLTENKHNVLVSIK